jgi:hypothetical protein
LGPCAQLGFELREAAARRWRLVSKRTPPISRTTIPVASVGSISGASSVEEPVDEVDVLRGADVEV